MSAANTRVLFRLYFIIEANNMNPDQTAFWKQSDLESYCIGYNIYGGSLRYMLIREQTTKVVTIIFRALLEGTCKLARQNSLTNARLRIRREWVRTSFTERTPH